MFGEKKDGPTVVPAHTVRVSEKTLCDGCRYCCERRIVVCLALSAETLMHLV